ncbi:MAG: hypothetical protein Fur0041_15970 [Bacteroidia bacterium]
MQMSVLLDSLKVALYQKDLHKIDSLNLAGKNILGTEAGQPEVLENFNTLSANTNWLSLNSALNLSRLLIAADSLVYAQIWKPCRGEAPPFYLPHSFPLRSGAEVCSGLIRIAFAETDINRRNAYLQWAKQGLDTLLRMQLPSGAFPFPDLRTYGDPVFTPIINNYLQSLGADSLNVLSNGWIIDDSGTGEFKFDAGVIGGVFAEAFMFTGDTNYRNAAVKVAAYLDTLRLNTNYNYNSFQAFGLSLGYAVAPGNTDWMMNAGSVLRYALLPGQIVTGRWMDGHNAKSVYHNIIIHNAAVVLRHAAPAAQWKDTISGMLCLSLRNFISLYDACGASVGFDGLLRTWKLDTTVIPQSLHDSLTLLIGSYINQAAINGRYLDVYTMGLYLDALQNLSTVNDSENSSILKTVVYPNPSTDHISVRFELLQENTITAAVYSSYGRKIETHRQVLFSA